MNLLPKSNINFAEKDYWESFFKKRDLKEFEWYGEYPELCSLLHKYVKPKDDILVVGCGNSQLSSNMYDVGYKKITNIDVSTIVIKQMKQQNREREGMTYEVMDALNTAYSDESFTVVLDKGTLDALMTQDSEEDRLRGRRLFAESHILRAILDECAEAGSMVRICRCVEVDEKTLRDFGQLRMPVFMIVCTKFRKSANLQYVRELSTNINEKPIRFDSNEEVQRAVKEIQDSAAMCNAVQKEILKEELEMEFQRDGDETARYTIRVVDKPPGTLNGRLLSYGALIVPHGRETEWMFGTAEGRQYLRKSSKFDRLAVISLHRNHVYPSLEKIQSELGNCVRQLAPHGLSSQIPYVTVGDSLGSRETVFKGSSELSGDFVVEDVTIENHRYRRLIFLNNQAVVQSEARMKEVSSKKGMSTWVVDSSYVSCSHHCYMVLPISITPSPNKCLILGLGGGGLCIFLQRMFPQLQITAVDIDPSIVEVARNFFGVSVTSTLTLQVADGLKYLLTCELSSFDVVMIDVDSKSNETALQCPPEDFVSLQTLNRVADVIGPSGILVLNLVCRVDHIKNEILKRIKNKFHLVARYGLEEDVNEIVFASCNPLLEQSEWRKRIETAAASLNSRGHKKMRKGQDLINVVHLLQNIELIE